MTSTERERRTDIVFNEIIVYVFVGLFGISTALVGWVAIQTVEQIRISTAIVEHSKSLDRRMDQFEITTTEQTTTERMQLEKINEMQVMMAQHGWR